MNKTLNKAYKYQNIALYPDNIHNIPGFIYQLKIKFLKKSEIGIFWHYKIQQHIITSTILINTCNILCSHHFCNGSMSCTLEKEHHRHKLGMEF